MKRRDEEFARKAWTRFLVEAGHDGEALWEDGAEPPDYRLKTSVGSFAVEVTWITDRVQLGEKTYAEPAVIAALRRFVRDLRECAGRESLVTGAYVLGLDGVSQLAERKPGLLEECLDYMRATQEIGSAQELVLLEVGAARWTIQKVHSDRCYVHGVYAASADGIWQGQIEKDLRSCLTKALERKAAKLSRVTLPRVLLLVDAYHLAESADWKACMPRDLLGTFHTVARVHGNHECQLLHSVEVSWARPVNMRLPLDQLLHRTRPCSDLSSRSRLTTSEPCNV